MRLIYVLLTAVLTLFFTSSCAFNKEDAFQSTEEVTLESIPSNSDIYINGESIGKTPMVLSLRSDISHEICFKREGFKTSYEYLNPVYKNNKVPYLQFGLVKDLGHYSHLSSNKVLSELKWESLPDSVGINSFEAMGELINEADDAHFYGVITKAEHKIIIRQIIELFN